MGGGGAVRGAAVAAQVFRTHAERLAMMWRRERAALLREQVCSPLEGLVEPFIAELGATLAGAPGHAWARTRGVLRLSPARGSRLLRLEFALLRRCLLGSLEALGGTSLQRRLVGATLEDALEASLSLLAAFVSESAALPSRVPFGGLVIESFDGPLPKLSAHPPNCGHGPRPPAGGP